MKKYIIVGLMAMFAFGSVAQADYYFAVTKARKSFVGHNDVFYRSLREAMRKCASDENVSVGSCLYSPERSHGERVVVTGRLFYYADNRDYQYRADRSAMNLCYAKHDDCLYHYSSSDVYGNRGGTR